MALPDAAEYFKKRQSDVVSWWNPEASLGAETYKRGMDDVIRERKRKEICLRSYGKFLRKKTLLKTCHNRQITIL